MQKTDSIIVPLGSVVREQLDSLLMGARPTRRCAILRSVAKQLDKAIIRCGRRASRDGSRSALIEYLRDPEHRYSQQWQIYFGVLIGTDQPVDVRHAEPEVIEAKGEPVGSSEEPSVGATPETGIELVDGWPFRLASKTLDGANAAVVSCSDLAERLGYAKSNSLKELSEKPEHAKILNSSGGVRVSRIPVKAGFTTHWVDEPLFSRKQALYLISKSGTPIANDLTWQFIDAFDALVQRFATSPAVNPAVLATIDRMSAAMDRASATMESQAKALQDVVARDLLREQNEAAKIEANRSWKEQQDQSKRRLQSKHQATTGQTELFPGEQTRNLIVLFKTDIGLLRHNAKTPIEADSCAKLFYAELREEFGKLKLELKKEDEERYCDVIVKNGWYKHGVDIANRIFEREKAATGT